MANYNGEAISYENARLKEAKAFENSKTGVKGLLDAGITQIPRIFHHPPETLTDYQPTEFLSNNDCNEQDIPVIDMSNPSHDKVVAQVRDAAKKFGFFQVVNHGVSVSLLNRLHDAVRAFHELPAEEKIGHYCRDVINTGTGFGFYSNHDLFKSKAACWRDTISARLGPAPVDPNDIPTSLRNEVMEWDKGVKELADRVMELLSEGLGLSADRLKGMQYIGRVAMMGHYYPYCPEPTKTVGNASHTDLGMLTILLQDQVGGLQVKYDDKWIDMKSIDGALVINIGDLLQILSNDEYISGEHRVYANPSQVPRVSVANFFHPGSDDALYGPLPELVSPENPAKYKQLKFSEALDGLLITESKKHVMANYFRL